MSEVRQLTPRMHAILGRAGGIAGEHGQQHIGTEHILLALLANRDTLAVEAIAKFANPDDIAAEIRRLAGMHPAPVGDQ